MKQNLKLGLGALALSVWATAQAGAPVVENLAMVPRLTIQSDLGITNQIQYSSNLSGTNWTVLTNLLVRESPYWYVDVGAPPAPYRFYRVLALNNPAPMNMVLIPDGSFTMGNCMAANGGESRELPLHEVYVSAFYMDKYVVAKALWDEVKSWQGGNGYSYENVGSGKTNNHPVQTVNWRDCVKWCNARSEKEGLTPCYYNQATLLTIYKAGTATPYPKWSANGYRLPTEAEWEKAARGGSVGHRFPWADADTITQSRANYNSYWSEGVPFYAYDVNATSGYHPAFNNGVQPYTSPVDYFAPNGYGLYDMAGNVSQWCWDWGDDSWYSNAGATQSDTRGPTGPPSYRVLRGGNWGNYANYTRCAFRNTYSNPDYANVTFGFRCVRGL